MVRVCGNVRWKNNTKITLLQRKRIESVGVRMELEDNGIGDVTEGEDRVEIHGPFLIGNAEGLLSLRVLTADKQTRPGMSSGGEMTWMA